MSIDCFKHISKPLADSLIICRLHQTVAVPVGPSFMLATLCKNCLIAKCYCVSQISCCLDSYYNLKIQFSDSNSGALSTFLDTEATCSAFGQVCQGSIQWTPDNTVSSLNELVFLKNLVAPAKTEPMSYRQSSYACPSVGGTSVAVCGVRSLLQFCFSRCVV